MPKLKMISVDAAAATVTRPPDVGFSQTLINATLACPLRGRLYANLWTSPKKEATTFFGSLTHDGLEAFYRGDRWEEAVWRSAKRRLSDARVDPDRVRVDYGASRAVLAVYSELHAEELRRRWLFTERSFDVAVDGYRARGRVDGGFAEGEAVKLVEHKTRAQIGGDFVTHLAYDFQSLFYALIVSVAMERPVSGILYNVIRRPSLRLRAGETIAEFVRRVEDDVFTRRAHYLNRWEITFTPRQMSLFRVNCVRKVAFTRTMLYEPGAWFRNESACLRPYRCEFLDACSCGNMSGCYQKQAAEL